MSVSRAFETFGREAPGAAAAWMAAVQGLDAANALDAKTSELAYIAVLAAVRLESGLAFHVAHAKALGATRDEIIGSVLVGMPAVGNTVIAALPTALDAYDAAPATPEG
jgi:alkylhydroperoxidase/carboxymuconolactone decarboxylase family protein YurZ